MNNPLKSIVIRGDIASNDIKYKLCPDYLQLQYGTWEVAIADIIFITLKQVEHDTVVEFSTNLVQGHSFSVSRRLCKENIILSTALYDKSKTKAIFTPNVLKWFVVNNVPSDFLIVFLTQWPSKALAVQGKVILSVNVLLRRIV